MKENVTGIRGQYRAPTPAEIASFVKAYRKAWDTKQATVAQEAGVSERTLQRLENGVKVSSDVYRKVAVAIDQKEDAFIGPRYIRTEEEAVREAVEFLKDWNAKYVGVDIEPIEGERVFERIFGCMAWVLDTSHLTGAAVDLAAEFRQNLEDRQNVKNDITEPNRLSAYRSLLAAVRAIEALGFAARYGVQTYPCPSLGKDRTMRIALVAFFPRTDRKRCALKTISAPRTLAGFEW